LLLIGLEVLAERLQGKYRARHREALRMVLRRKLYPEAVLRCGGQLGRLLLPEYVCNLRLVEVVLVYDEGGRSELQLVLRFHLWEIETVPVLEPLTEEVDGLVQILDGPGDAGEQHVPAAQCLHDRLTGSPHEAGAL